MISIFKKTYKILHSNLKEFYTNLDSIMRRIYSDRFLSMVFIFVILGCFLFPFITYYFPEISINSFSNLVDIYAILGGILGSLLIFIMAEGLSDKKDLYKVSICLNSSKLITIIISFLISLPLLLFQEYRSIFIVSFLLLFGFIGFSIFAIIQVAIVIFNDEELRHRHIDLFKSKIKKVTKFSLKIKSNSEDFYDFIKKPSNQIKWLIPKEESNHISLKSLKEGTITSVELEDLENIIKKIKKQEPNKPTPKLKRTENSKIKQFPKPRQKEEGKKNKNIILHICIGQKIEEKSDLLSYDKDIRIDTSKIQKKLNDAIVVKRITVLDKIKADLESYKFMIKRDIEEENTFQFTRYFELYFKLAEGFLNELPKPYSYQQAKREVNFVLDSNWPQLDWLQDHIMDFFSQVRDKKLKNQFKTESLDEIYLKIKWFSYRLINLSKERKDHLLFQIAFRLWIKQLYILSQKENSSDQKDIKDHIDFFKEHLFRNILDERLDKKEKEGYIIYLLEITKSILGWILKKDKYNFLDDIENIINTITNNRSRGSFRNQVEQKSIDRQEVFQNLESYNSRKLQFLFGLGAFLESLTENKLNNLKRTIKDSILGDFKFDLKNFLNIYPLMKIREIDSFWQWSFFNTPADGQWRKREDNTEDYFLKLMLDFHETEFERLKIEEVDSQTLSHLEYLSLTTYQKSQKPEKIDKILQKVSAYQSKKRVEYIISKENLEQNKIKEFRKKFETDFKETAYMRALFKKPRVIQQIKNDFIWDMDYIDFKSYFISHKTKPNDINLDLAHPIDFSNGMPEAYSEGLSEAENKFLQVEILKKCTKKEKEISYSDFRTALTDRQWKNNKEVILVSSRRFLKTIEDLIEWDKKDNNSIFKYNFLSKNGKIPLKIDFLIKNQNVNAVIFDTSKLPMLEMFNPINAKKELFNFHFLEDIGISIGIDAFSSNDKLMEFIIKNPPDWLIEKGSEKDQREYLKQMVNIKILQGLYLNWERIEGYIGEYFVIKN